MAGLDGDKKRSNSSTPRVSRFSEVLGAAQQNTQTSGYPDSQLSVQPQEKSEVLGTAQQNTQTSGYPDSQLSVQPHEKIAKRENPDYTQTTFRIPKKLSRQLNRVLMDLADEGIEIDRSDLLESLASALIRLSEEVGAVKALEQVKNLGTQVDE